MEADSRPSRGRGRPKTIDRADIIERAMVLLWEHGPGLLSVNELCDRIGVSKPGLYREFGGEDGLLSAVLAHYYAVRIEPLLEKLCQERPIAEAIDKLADWLITAPTALPAGCLFAKARTTIHPLGPKARVQIESMRERQLATLTAWMERMAGRGELAPGVDPAMAGRYIDTQITTLLMLVANAEPPPSVEAQTHLAFAGITGAGVP